MEGDAGQGHPLGAFALLVGLSQPGMQVSACRVGKQLVRNVLTQHLQGSCAATTSVPRQSQASGPAGAHEGAQTFMARGQEKRVGDGLMACLSMLNSKLPRHSHRIKTKQ